MNKFSTSPVKKQPILKIEKGESIFLQDFIVVEEPLEIQLHYFSKGNWRKKSLAITMRTPGNDEALAIGFLFSEGVIGHDKDILSVERIDDNVLLIKLSQKIWVDLSSLERNFYATSSCGICGKASIEKLTKTSCFFPHASIPKITGQTLMKLPYLLREIQNVFNQTGGIHAAAIFSSEGELITVAEDVGRHNAVDKLIGNCLQIGKIPLRKEILVLSGRISFELVQKAMMAGIPIIAAVGAPSSLAIELAEESGITLVGFLKVDRFNVYSGQERLGGRAV